MQEILPKSPQLRKETAHALVISAIVVLIGIGGFGLGRLTALGEAGKGRVAIHAPEMTAALAEATPLGAPLPGYAQASSSPPVIDDVKAASSTPPAPVAHHFVASKNGTKYYSSTCSGAARIKAANQVWFATAADAQAAGYSLSATCKK